MDHKNKKEVDSGSKNSTSEESKVPKKVRIRSNSGQKEEKKKPFLSNPVKFITMRSRGKNKDPVLPSTFNETESIDSQLLKGVKQGNMELIINFFDEIQPQLTRDLAPILTECLIAAIEENQFEIFQLFLERQVDPNGVAEINSTPLMFALESKKLNFVLALLKSPLINVNQSCSSSTPLHLATANKYYECIEMILEKGGHVNRVDAKTGTTSLHIATEQQDAKAALLLLNKGADLAILQSTNGQAPLHMAIFKFSYEDLLLTGILEKAQKIGKINSQNKKGETVVHVFVRRVSDNSSSSIANTNILNLILQQQPDLSIKNNQEQTPLSLAKALGLPKEIISLLQNYKIDEPLPTVSSVSSFSSFSSQPKNSPPLRNLALTMKVNKDYQAVKNFKILLEEKFLKESFLSEYTKLTSTSAFASTKCVTALQLYNQQKNYVQRAVPCLLVDEHRVTLNPIDEENSDYICASILPSNSPYCPFFYIITQTPLNNTLYDFWRMVFQYNVTVIIILEDNYHPNSDLKRYWSDRITFQMNEFSISKVGDFSPNQSLSVKEFLGIDSKNQTRRSIKQISFHSWEDPNLPSPDSFISLLKYVDSCHEEINTPILIHNTLPNSKTGVFYVVHDIWTQLNHLLTSSFEPKLNIEENIKLLRKQYFPDLVNSKDEYRLCFLFSFHLVGIFLPILEYKNEKTFHKDADSQKTQLLLNQKPDGTFLFRPSSELGYIVCCVVGEGKLIQSRLAVKINGFATTEGEQFPNLKEFIKSRQEVLKYPLFDESK